MTAGGARPRSGPAPDPNALRRARKDDAGWTTLPDNRAEMAAPEFPLPEPSERELELWAQWWAHPVALVWEQGQETYYVAFTVRMFAEAEKPGARTEDRKSLRTMMADLYLTPDAQAKARLRIAGTTTPAESAAPSAPAPRRSSARDRLVVHDGGA